MTVKFGVALPNCTEGLCYPTGFTSPDVIVRMAQAAEQLGFDSVWCNDHFSTQHYVRERWPDPPNYYEPLITLALVAGATRTIRLGTCVIVVPSASRSCWPSRPRRSTSSAQGRLIFGVGVGAYREEFEATYPRRKGQNRGAIHAEGLEALSRLFRDRRASYAGRYLQFEDVELYPKPVQQPLPMWTSGNTRVAAERAGRWCQGWLPAVMPAARWPIRDILRESAHAAGRDPAGIEIAPQIALCIGAPTSRRSSSSGPAGCITTSCRCANRRFKDQDLSGVENLNLIGTPTRSAKNWERSSPPGVPISPA